MVQITKITGISLMFLGIGFYFGTGQSSFTALIPAFFGIFIYVLGYFSTYEKLRKHLQHAALGLALLGFLGSISGLFKMISLLFGSTVDRPLAAIEQGVMAIILIIYLGYGIQSFKKARQKKTE